MGLPKVKNNNFLKVLSLNTQGLKTKALDVIHYFKKYDICLAQELNVLDGKNVKYIQSLYDGIFYYNRPTNGTRSTGMFINKRIVTYAKEISHKILVPGQAHQITIKLPHCNIVCLNIYGNPDHDGNSNLFTEIENKLDIDIPCILLMGGDFNTILDKELDQENYSSSGIKKIEIGSKQLSHLIDSHELVDIFRDKYYKEKSYTFYKSFKDKSVIKSRLDRIYINKQNKDDVINYKFVPVELSDHFAIEIHLCIKDSIRHRPSHWKLNVSLLEDQNLIEKIETIYNSWVTLKSLFPNTLMWWESFKMRLKVEFSEFGRLKKMKEQHLVDSLSSKLHGIVINGMDTESDMRSFTEIKAKLRELKEKNLRGTMIRAREKDIVEGEKMSSYFFRRVQDSLTKRSFTSLLHKNGNLKSSNYEMRDIVHDFYSDLYSKEDTDGELQTQMLENDNFKLDESQRNICEGLLTKSECFESVSKMGKMKTPGSDGLPAEFYQKFWYLMGDEITNALNDIYTLGELSESQKLALITLLYKKNNEYDLGNWRPISLLNVDVKIVSKTLAVRLGKVLPHLIIKLQSCSVKGRTITDNIITIQNLIELCHEHKKNMFVVSLDQLKAFDRLDHQWMLKVLHHYNFGPSFIKWIRILYTDIKSKGIVNGFLTKSISINRGVRQGCPLSPLLYIIAMNPIANDIINDNLIVGINSFPVPNSIAYFTNRTPNRESIKLSAYADDMTCTLNTAESVENLIQKFNLYEQISGSKLNVNKTEILKIGNPPSNPFVENFTKNKLNILGIPFTHNGVDESKWETIHQNIKRMLSSWSTRKMTIRGRMTLATSVALAQLWYIARCIPISQTMCTSIERDIVYFIWRRQYDPIKRDILHLPYIKGGLNLPNIKIKCDLLLADRIIHLCQPNADKQWANLSLFWLRNTLMKEHPFLKNQAFPISSNIRPLYKKIINIYSHHQRICPGPWCGKRIKELYGDRQDRLLCKPTCETRDPSLNWTYIWQYMKPFTTDQYSWETAWNLIHRTLPTGEHKEKRNLFVLNNDFKCYFCGENETDIHLFYECEYTKEIIKKGEDIILNKTNFREKIEPRLFINHAVHSLNTTEANKQLISKVWGLMKFVIWKYRNIIKSGEKPSKIMLRVHFTIENNIRKHIYT